MITSGHVRADVMGCESSAVAVCWASAASRSAVRSASPAQIDYNPFGSANVLSDIGLICGLVGTDFPAQIITSSQRAITDRWSDSKPKSLNGCCGAYPYPAPITSAAAFGACRNTGWRAIAKTRQAASRLHWVAATVGVRWERGRPRSGGVHAHYHCRAANRVRAGHHAKRALLEVKGGRWWERGGAIGMMASASPVPGIAQQDALGSMLARV